MSPSPDEEIIDSSSNENRFFLKVFIADRPYLALFDPGATISAVGPRLANEFRDRLEAVDSTISSALG